MRPSDAIAALLLALPLSVHAQPTLTPLAAPSAHSIGKDELPRRARRSGTRLVRALAWRDAAGDNLATFWRTLSPALGNARLQVDLWSSGEPGGAPHLMRTIKDAVMDCDLDLTAEYDESALGVTDVDADGLYELTFAYRLACRGDVSPATLKVVMLEQRDKYIIRGSDMVDVGYGEQVGGERQLDEALERSPRFRQHAESVWAKIVATPESS